VTSLRFRTVISPEAAAQIVEQADYYRLESGTALANRWRDAVRDAARSLRVMPERNAIRYLRRSRLRDVRRLQIDGFPNHSLFYRVDGQTVHILYMLHGARDIEALFASKFPEL
jgi:plasmid stabilization system protein ParE